MTRRTPETTKTPSHQGRILSRGHVAALYFSWCLGALVVSSSYSDAADLPDWLHARLGQTSAAVAAGLGDKAMRLDPPLDYGAAKAKLLMKGVDVGGVAMTALYQFDAEDRLAQVLLERRDAGSTPKSFAAIEGALKQSLGKPAQACEKQRGTPRLVERRWKSGGTSVHLTFMDFTGSAMTLDPSKDFLNPLVPSYQYETFKPRSFPRRIVLRYFPIKNAELEGSPACR